MTLYPFQETFSPWSVLSPHPRSSDQLLAIRSPSHPTLPPRHYPFPLPLRPAALSLSPHAQAKCSITHPISSTAPITSPTPLPSFPRPPPTRPVEALDLPYPPPCANSTPFLQLKTTLIPLSPHRSGFLPIPPQAQRKQNPNME